MCTDDTSHHYPYVKTDTKMRTIDPRLNKYATVVNKEPWKQRYDFQKQQHSTKSTVAIPKQVCLTTCFARSKHLLIYIHRQWYVSYFLEGWARVGTTSIDRPMCPFAMLAQI
jgi:hypothetical protein